MKSPNRVVIAICVSGLVLLLLFSSFTAVVYYAMRQPARGCLNRRGRELKALSTLDTKLAEQHGEAQEFCSESSLYNFKDYAENSQIECRQKHLLLEKIHQSREIHVTALGGSVTADGKYVRDFISSLSEAINNIRHLNFPVQINYLNLGVGGRDSHTAYYCSNVPSDTDIVILDFAINDAEIIRDTAYGEKAEIAFDPSYITNLILQLKQDCRQALIILLLLPGRHQDEVAYRIRLSYKSIGKELGVLVVDFYEIIASNLSYNYQDEWQKRYEKYFSADRIHPQAKGHEMISDSLLQHVLYVQHVPCFKCSHLIHQSKLPKPNCISLQMREIDANRYFNVTSHGFVAKSYKKKANVGLRVKRTWTTTKQALIVFDLYAQDIEIVHFQKNAQMNVADVFVDEEYKSKLNGWFRGLPWAPNGSRNKVTKIFNGEMCAKHSVKVITHKTRRPRNFQIVAILYTC